MPFEAEPDAEADGARPGPDLQEIAPNDVEVPSSDPASLLAEAEALIDRAMSIDPRQVALLMGAWTRECDGFPEDETPFPAAPDDSR